MTRQATRATRLSFRTRLQLGSPCAVISTSTAFLKAHRSNLAELGRTTCRAMPLAEEHVMNHLRLVSSKISSDYEYQDGSKPEDRNKRRWASHAVRVIGLHCGLRLDELVNLRIKGFSLGSQYCFTLAVKTKNSDDFKSYQFSAWPNAYLE
jgi:hypothetical protein